MLWQRLYHMNDAMHMVRHQLKSQQPNLGMELRNLLPCPLDSQAHLRRTHPRQGMIVIRTVQLAQQRTPPLNAQGHHIDSDTTIVMSRLATFHRRLGDKFRVSLNPPLPAFIAVIHKDKISDNPLVTQGIEKIFTTFYKLPACKTSTPPSSQCFSAVRVLRAGSP